LYQYTGDESIIAAAQNLIDAVIASPLVPSDNGVLVEACDASGTCDQDAHMFKGVFFEHLGYFLDDISKMQELSIETRKALLEKYANFVRANANAVWDVRNASNGIGSWWAATATASAGATQVTVETQGSGIAAATCAFRLDTALQSLEGASSAGANEGLREQVQ